MSEAQPSNCDESQIRFKRIKTLQGIYKLITDGWDPNYPTILHDVLVASTVEQYLRERRLLKIRDKIPDKIQRHKVAGLMTSAIVSNRPIQVPAPGSPEGVSNSFDNEYFAVIHGLAICAEDYDDGKLDQFLIILILLNGVRILWLYCDLLLPVQIL